MTAHPPPPSPPITPGARPTATSRALRAGAGFLLILYSMLMIGFYRVPLIVQQPGSAENVLGLLRVEEGVELYEPKGELLFLTVSISKQLTVLGAMLARLDDDSKLLPEDAFTNNRPREEVRRDNLAMMQESKLAALKVGLEYAGYEVGTVGHGPVVGATVAGGPAEGRLRDGDTIVAVDGSRTRLTSDVQRLVRGREVGDTVTLTVRREGRRRDVTLTTIDDGTGVPIVGVNLLENVSFDFPVDIDIDTGQVGGPSAGLAFALAVIDELTPGELTGGKVVAVTGAIELDGTVTRVGGVEQKAVAAREQGAQLMLVPAGEVKQARRHAGDMKVRGVRDVDDALRALGGIGGDLRAVEGLRGR